MSYLMSWVDVFTEKLLKLNEILINGNNEIRGEKEMCTSCSYQISARETFHRAKKKHFVVILGFLTSENGGIKSPCNKQVIRKL